VVGIQVDACVRKEAGRLDGREHAVVARGRLDGRERAVVARGRG
jgi:hypothetical protein